MALRNVTVTLDERLLREARHRAVDRGMSLSGYMAWVLNQQGATEQAYQTAMKRGLKRMHEGIAFDFDGTVTWTRDELHER